MTTNTTPSGADALRDKLISIIADHLSGTYHCRRVWSAWSYGTMSQDDFEDVGESDTPAELADAIMAALSAAQDAARGAQWVDLTDDDRERAFKSMPDMLDGFLKKWGWLHFAKAIEAICREKNANRATQEAPAQAAQAVPQGFSTKVLNAIQQLIAYSEGSKSAEIVRHCRELSAWIDTAQAQEAAPAARGEPSDTERLDWLATHAKRWWHSGDGYYLQELRFRWGDSLISRTLREAVDDARAAQRKGASNG